MKLIQVTDPHLNRPGDMLFGIDPGERLALCFADINARHANADLCVITGDLTCGQEGAYARLRELLGELTTPWQLLLGNHDDRDAFLRYFPDAKTDANGFVQHAQEIGGFTLLFLDTLEPGSHAGGYCERRQEWLARELEASGDRPVYIFMHHPPLCVGIPALDAICLVQRDSFKEVLAPHKRRIRHIFFGHLHRPVHGSWGGIPFSGLRGTAHQCWLDFEERVQPLGSFEPPAYAVILANETSTIIHLHEFLDQGAPFPL